MKKRKINYIGLSLIIIILLLLISNIYILVDRSKNYLRKDYLLQLAEKYDNISIRLLNEIFPNMTFYFYKNELQIEPALKIDRNPYDFEQYLDASGNYYFYNDSKIKSYRGIDVSSHNGEIDWQAVKDDGVEFVFVRCGYRGYSEGVLHEDEYFEENIKGAIAAGLDVGVYFFSQAIDEYEAIEEANFVLDLIKDYTLSYPVVFDMEEISNPDNRTKDLDKETVTKLTRIFCDKIKASGNDVMIYGNRNWLMGMLDLEEFEDIDKWLALYNSNPNYVYEYKIWQYSESGRVNGIDGNVDLNISFKKY